MSSGEPPTSEMLHSLGSGMLILSPSILSGFSKDALNNSMSSLIQTEWKPAQAKILAQKLLEKVKVRSEPTIRQLLCPAVSSPFLIVLIPPLLFLSLR